jgi:hypothetical protein
MGHVGSISGRRGGGRWRGGGAFALWRSGRPWGLSAWDADEHGRGAGEARVAGDHGGDRLVERAEVALDGGQARCVLALEERQREVGARLRAAVRSRISASRARRSSLSVRVGKDEVRSNSPTAHYGQQCYDPTPRRRREAAASRRRRHHATTGPDQQTSSAWGRRGGERPARERPTGVSPAKSLRVHRALRMAPKGAFLPERRRQTPGAPRTRPAPAGPGGPQRIDPPAPNRLDRRQGRTLRAKAQ